MQRKSLTQFLVEQQREQCALPAQLRLLLEVVARACKRIGYTVNQAGTDGLLGDAGAINVQGEAQKRLDVMANEILLEANEWGGHLAAMASEEMASLSTMVSDASFMPTRFTLVPSRRNFKTTISTAATDEMSQMWARLTSIVTSSSDSLKSKDALNRATEA